MFSLRPSADRGHLDHGWLNTYHTFSFAEYHDPLWMGFGPLRVINEDRIAANMRFGDHYHRDMEILTYVIEGELQHRDNLGSGSIIRPGRIQYMSAGHGIVHSEFNPAETSVHLLQIWIEPNEMNAAPRYAEKELGQVMKGTLQLMASADGREDSIAIRQMVDVYRGMLGAREGSTFSSQPQRKQWVQMISGEMKVGDVECGAGDACAVEGEVEFRMTAQKGCHFLLFDLPE